MKLCRFQIGPSRPRIGLVRDQGTILDLSAEGIDQLTSLFEFEGLAAQLGALANQSLPQHSLTDVKLLAPVEQQEVWAVGVTYLRSKKARMEESDFSATAYDKVYDAPRPELFFKSSAIRDVPVHDYQMFYSPAAAPDCTGRGFKGSPGTVLVAHSVLDLATDALCSRLCGRFVNASSIVGVNLIERRSRSKLLQTVTENFLVSRAVVDTVAISVDYRDHVGSVLSDQTKHFFPFEEVPSYPINLNLLKDYVDVEKKHQANEATQHRGHLSAIDLQPTRVQGRDYK